MALSFAGLVGFCGQWVHSQYAREKERLLGDLIAEYEQAGRETMDSLLLRNVLRPLLREQKIYPMPGRDSMRIFVSRNLRFSTGRKADSIFREEYTEQIVAGKKRARAIVIRDTLQERGFLSNNLPDSSNAMLLKGVQLLVNRMGGATSGEELFSSPAADSLLRRRFAALSEVHGWNFDTRFVTQDSAPFRQNGLVVGNALPDAGPRLEVAGYRGYILRQIAPQIGFAVLLVLLTGAAFMISWTNLKRQMQLNAMKNDFISNMSHELKTPVATVKVALEAIDRFRVSEDAQRTKEYLEMARLEMDRLEMLVHQSLNTAMLEDGRLAVANEEVDARAVVESLVRVMTPRIEQVEGQLSVRYDGSQFAVRADRLQLQGVLVNLLDNAVKYGGACVQVEVLLKEEQDVVRVDVADNGPGIPREYRIDIFKPYFRVPTGNEHSVKGYGLGLSYSKQAMERMGGTIAAHECAGGGCRFTIQLPKA